MIPWKWNGDRRFECRNSSGGIGAHFFRRFNGHPLQFDGVAFGRNPHDRRHACRQSSRNEIGRRKRFALSLVVDGSIGFQFGSRRAVKRRAVQLPFVPNGNFNQGSWLALTCAWVTCPTAG